MPLKIFLFGGVYITVLHRLLSNELDLCGLFLILINEIYII